METDNVEGRRPFDNAEAKPERHFTAGGPAEAERLGVNTSTRSTAKDLRRGPDSNAWLKGGDGLISH